jgi:putative flippase GtrA
VVEVFAPELLFSIGFDYEFFGIKGFSAKALVSIVIIVINYIFSKLVVFSKKRD